MRRPPPTEPMLYLYRSHDRELLFHGNIDQAKAAGIRIKKDLSSFVFQGWRWQTTNRHLPVGGDVMLWGFKTKEREASVAPLPSCQEASAP